MTAAHQMPWDHDKSTTERGYGWKWQKLRIAIMKRDKGLCQPCERVGRYTPATQVDHIKPKAQGGSDDENNLQSICGDCHDEKTAQDNNRTVKSSIGVDGWPTPYGGAGRMSLSEASLTGGRVEKT